MNSHPNITHLINPRNAAVVGASNNPGKAGHIVVDNLLRSGFEGEIFPVNPKGGKIAGLTVLRSIAELPEELDLAIICVPARHVVPVAQELGRRKTRSIVVLAAGFREGGLEGRRLEKKLKEVARTYRMVLLGPNSPGLVNTRNGLNTGFAPGFPPAGNIAFFSQSGSLYNAALESAEERSFGFSKLFGLGNKAVLTESDILDYLSDDPDTKVILGICESLDNGLRFIRSAHRATSKKPVILLKAGRTQAGARAAGSHTGAAAGPQHAYDSAFRQAGIIRARTLQELFDLGSAFSSQPLPEGPSLLMVTNAGGLGILAADACEDSRLTPTEPSGNTVKALRTVLPSTAGLYNPVDIIGDADAERLARAVEIAAEDENTHALLVLLVPTAAMVPNIEAAAQAIADTARTCSKPVFACLTGGKTLAPGRAVLREAGIPCLDYPEQAVRCIEALYDHRLRIEASPPVEVCFRRDLTRAESAIRKARDAGFKELTGFRSAEVVEAYEMPMSETRTARTGNEAATAAKKIGFPVVLKINSPHIPHKTDVRGVVTGLNSEDEVRQAFMEITARAARMRPEAFISGCLVQKMAPPDSRELVINFKRDPRFGPLIMFGLGGIYVEVLRDIAFRTAPLTLDDAQQIIREIKSFPLLRGLRGDPPVDFKAVEDILLTVSQLAMDFPEILEADFNPVLAGPEGAVVADVRMTLDQELI